MDAAETIGVGGMDEVGIDGTDEEEGVFELVYVWDVAARILDDEGDGDEVEVARETEETCRVGIVEGGPGREERN